MPREPSNRPRSAKLGRWLGIFLAPLALCAAACAKPSAQKLNDDGNHAYARGDYQPALDDYRRAQVARPDLPALSYNAGNTLYQQGDYTRAVGESQRAANAADAEIAAKGFYSLGENYYRQGKLQDALDAFKNALRIDPSDHDAKYNVEVIQAQLDREAANLAQIQQQAQQNQQKQPTPQPNGQNGANPQSQPGAQGQPTPPAQQGQPSQGGQPQPGQQGQPGQPGQPGNPQQGQGAQPQPGQQGQPGQNQPNAAGQPGQPGAQTAPGGQPGAVGTPGPTRQQQAQALQGELQAAIAQYSQTPSIDQALQILDILAQQEQLAQAQQAGRTPPGVTDK